MKITVTVRYNFTNITTLTKSGNVNFQHGAILAFLKTFLYVEILITRKIKK